MSTVPVTIVGIETREDGSSSNVTIVGMASLTGLGVGGGPMPPTGIWPGGKPEHPIVIPPPGGGGPPTGIWPGPGPLPGVEHPIVIPPPPELPPPDGTPPQGPGMSKPPPAEGGWGYHPVFGWGYFPGPGQAQPK